MESSIRFRIQSMYENLRASEKQVADFVLAHLVDVENYSLVELCEAAGVSQPTVIRFTKAIGFEGYRGFRSALLKSNAKGQNEPFQPLYCFPVQKEKMLEDTLRCIPQKDYEEAVKLLGNARMIDLYCVENSYATAADLLSKLLYLGLNTRLFQDSYLQHICAGHLTGQDVAVGISYTGRSSDTVKALSLAKAAGAKTIAVTNDRRSPILQYADVKLCVGEEPSVIYGNAVFSRANQVVLVDMLYIGLLNSDYRRFTKALDISSELVTGRDMKV